NESIIIMSAQLDPPGPQIVYVNPAFTKMTGYAPEDVIGKTPRILRGPKTDRSVISELRKDCAAGKVFHGEMINYRKGRSEIYLEWTAGPVRNERGEVTHFAAALRDMTERRRVEEELRRSEAQLRAILDQFVTAVFVKDLEGRYLRINRKCEVLFGMTEAEAKGKTNYDIHTKEIADALRANDQKVIAANTPLKSEDEVAAVEGRTTSFRSSSHSAMRAGGLTPFAASPPTSPSASRRRPCAKNCSSASRRRAKRPRT